MSRATFTRAALCLALVAAVAALSGCGRLADRPQGVAPGGPAKSQTASASVPATSPVAAATATAQSASPSGVSAATGTVSGKGLSAADAKAIDDELSAIQGELDRTSVPSDNDFDGISSGLK